MIKLNPSISKIKKIIEKNQRKNNIPLLVFCPNVEEKKINDFLE